MTTAKNSKRVKKSTSIFLSYGSADLFDVERITEYLTKTGHTVISCETDQSTETNFYETITEITDKVDVIIFIISANSIHSKWAQMQFSAISLQQISRKKATPIIAVRLDDSGIPSYMGNQIDIDLSQNINTGLSLLSDALTSITSQRNRHSPPPPEEANENKITRIKECLHKGRLTLFCGAGVSVGAGIPQWNDLLLKLLESMMAKLSANHSLNIDWNSAKRFQERNGTSSLILGKYLKNNLGNDFAEEVRKALYSTSPSSCQLIESIVNLARPQRDGRPLDSIVTFNFDCLIEEALDAAKIANKAIFSESIGHDPNQIPIYHAHGYLARTTPLEKATDLVFSEDAYHSQFIEPFSWSNLIQLNKLTQNTCLFVGISLTDPNMRRLLDVAWRKNPEKRLGHFILKKTPKGQKAADDLDEVIKLLEEQDANALGLNVIWYDDHDEIPSILDEIAKHTS